MGLRVLKTPVGTPQANALCEHLVGTIRRECLDWLIPLNERHLRLILREWVTHYNRGRPPVSLGPGIPEASPAQTLAGCRQPSLPRAMSSGRDAYSSMGCITCIAGCRRPRDGRINLRSTGGPLNLLPFDSSALRGRSASATYEGRNPQRMTNLGPIGNTCEAEDCAAHIQTIRFLRNLEAPARI